MLFLSSKCVSNYLDLVSHASLLSCSIGIPKELSYSDLIKKVVDDTLDFY